MIPKSIQFKHYTRFLKDPHIYKKKYCLNSPNYLRNVSIINIVVRQSSKLEEVDEFISSVK